MSTQPKTKKRPILLIVIGVLLAICVLCAIVASAMRAVGILPTLTPSVVSTSTLPPTATFTPAPTGTSIPTSTVTTLLSDPYWLELGTKFQNYQDAYLAFFEQHKKVQDDISLLTDKDWKTQTAISLAVLDLAATNMESIENVPEKYSQLDSWMDLVASETHTLIKNYAYAIDNIDAHAMDNATSNIANITIYLNNAMEEIDRIKSQP